MNTGKAWAKLETLAGKQPKAWYCASEVRPDFDLAAKEELEQQQGHKLRNMTSEGGL